MLYEKPIMEVLRFGLNDVVLTSFDDGTDDNETPSSGNWG